VIGRTIELMASEERSRENFSARRRTTDPSSNPPLLLSILTSPLCCSLSRRKITACRHADVGCRSGSGGGRFGGDTSAGIPMLDVSKRYRRTVIAGRRRNIKTGDRMLLRFMRTFPCALSSTDFAATKRRMKMFPAS